MSGTVFIILCKKCKKVKFNQGDTNFRNCPSCRTTNKNEMRERYNVKRRQKRNERSRNERVRIHERHENGNDERNDGDDEARDDEGNERDDGNENEI